jgi:diguanylate cyclase (GGDEF)-like protein
MSKNLSYFFRQVWGQRRTAREWQRSALYPLVGFLLAQGAPLGMLVTRAWEQRAWPTVTWLLGELAADRLAYVYLVLSTTTVFVSLGLLLGSQEDRLRRLAVTDPLTGLLNRRYFSARLHQELARAKRYETPLSLLIVDLDWLKAINDGSGHDAGDKAIRAVAATLEHSLRATDIAARYAGDEFAALLPQTSAQEAMGLARRISAQVRELGLGPEGGPLSVSIGVADLEGSGGSSAEELFTAADEALYAAKAAGRNSVMAASSVTLSVFGALEHRA